MRPDYSLKRHYIHSSTIARALNGCPHTLYKLGEGAYNLTRGRAGLVRANAGQPYIPWFMVRSVVTRWEGLERVGARPCIESLTATSLYRDDERVQEFARGLLRSGGQFMAIVNPDLSDHDQIVLDRIIRLAGEGKRDEARYEAEGWLTTSPDGKRYREMVLADVPQEKYHDA